MSAYLHRLITGIKEGPIDANVLNKQTALQFIDQARHRIEKDHEIGGVYWRLAQLLNFYVEPQLDEKEGKIHADYIRQNHGVLTVPKKSAELKETLLVLHELLGAVCLQIKKAEGQL